MGMEDTIDLGYLFRLLKKNLIFIIIIGIICGAGVFCVSNFLLERKYQSRALLYVENSQQTSEAVNINDISAAQKLVNTCQIIFKSEALLQDLINNLNLPYSTETLNKMITAQSVNSTEVMEIVVESTSPQEAQMVANELVRLANVEFLRIIKAGSIEVIDYGRISPYPVFPNTPLYTAIGVVIGMLIACVIVYISDMLDVAIKHDDNIAKIYNVPVFAEITDFDTASGSGKYSYSHGYGYGYGYGYGTEQEKKKAASGSVSAIPDRTLSADTPFPIVEAYNTARTNIMFAAAPEKKKIIAVTSSNPSEGKSTTCANIAIAFANAGYEVLLVECDLRKPTMAKRFKLKGSNGLSTILGGFCNINEAIHQDVFEGLDVIMAGDIPPNPSELLGSDAMKVFLEASSDVYDYIFLDTPPVNVVTDSQLMNESIAGLVFVVKENATTHPGIESALEKITLANGKTLGFIKTFCKPEKSGRYGKYGKKYGYGYGKYGYGYGYSNREASPDEQQHSEKSDKLRKKKPDVSQEKDTDQEDTEY